MVLYMLYLQSAQRHRYRTAMYAYQDVFAKSFHDYVANHTPVRDIDHCRFLIKGSGQYQLACICISISIGLVGLSFLFIQLRGGDEQRI